MIVNSFSNFTQHPSNLEDSLEKKKTTHFSKVVNRSKIMYVWC